jgi:hypothetical protein
LIFLIDLLLLFVVGFYTVMRKLKFPCIHSHYFGDIHTWVGHSVLRWGVRKRRKKNGGCSFPPTFLIKTQIHTPSLLTDMVGVVEWKALESL